MLIIFLRLLAIPSIVLSIILIHDIFYAPVKFETVIVKDKRIENCGTSKRKDICYNIVAVGKNKYIKGVDKEIYDLLEIGGVLKLSLSRFLDEWIHMTVLIDGKKIIKVRNVQTYGMLFFAILTLVPALTFSPKIKELKSLFFTFYIITFGGISSVLIVRVIMSSLGYISHV